MHNKRQFNEPILPRSTRRRHFIPQVPPLDNNNNNPQGIGGDASSANVCVSNKLTRDVIPLQSPELAPSKHQRTPGGEQAAPGSPRLAGWLLLLYLKDKQSVGNH